ncbi:DNA repair protein HhH-GPD [Paractinoplanes deccanensis]|uniref:DNA repair protein HhH-GPD n=1 Tax=Paractinoplanes deccanensis TaxID=113561 RepID=A0ABQ3Y4E2_9ACTN|nr:SulP family inorganic anion transporter [Actinoplanes deccanensis]GID74866.1 DNA repair protein HhH-GPD [Actinoplanes deccanensis]
MRFSRADLLAGATVWAVLIPESLAYASIAGVSPVAGLYAAPAALVLYAIFGSSRHLVVGPMSATAALSAGVVAPLAKDGDYAALTAGVAVVVGVMALIAGLLRLGFLAGLISEPVLKGFIIGLALTIIIGQVPKLIGVEKGTGDFFAQAWHALAEMSGINWLAAAVGVASLAVLLTLRRFLPKLPASLLVVALSVLAVTIFGLDRHGLDVVGHIDSGLPHYGLPDLSLGDYGSLAGGAAGILLVGFAEGLGAAKTYATKAGYPISPNRELIGLGAANVGAGLSSGMVVNGSLSKTAVNGGAGARTQLSGLVVAALTIVTLLFLTGLFERLPEATLAAVVIVAVVDLVDLPAMGRLYRMSSRRLAEIYGYAARADFAAALAALLGVLVFDTLPGLLLGVAVSMVLLLYRAAHTNVAVLGREHPGGQWNDLARHPGNATVPDVAVVRIEGGLFFANADHVRERIRQLADGKKAVVVDARAMPFIDATGAGMLTDLTGELERKGVRLVLAGDIGQVRDILDRTAKPTSVDDAVTAASSSPAPPG